MRTLPDGAEVELAGRYGCLRLFRLPDRYTPRYVWCGPRGRDLRVHCSDMGEAINRVPEAEAAYMRTRRGCTAGEEE